MFHLWNIKWWGEGQLESVGTDPKDDYMYFFLWGRNLVPRFVGEDICA
jgi:hypothetical protein